MTSKMRFILIAAFLIRLIAFNQSFWLDEATTANVVKYYTYSEIWTRFSPTDFHPPFYYLFLKSWSLIFGTSEIALRLPSLLFSLLIGWLVYLIGKSLKNEQFGFWAALFFLFNPLIVYYSQEARMYMMATFFLTTAVYFLEKKSQCQNSKIPAKRDPAPRDKFQNYFGNTIYFNLCMFLGFFTFYGSIFFIITISLYLLYKKDYRYFFILCFTISVLIFFLVPLIFQQLNHAREQLVFVVNWAEVLGKVSLKNILLIPIKFAFGRISFYPKSVYYAIAGLWTVLVWFFVVKGVGKNRLLGFLFVAPLVFGLMFSFISPLFQYFRFLYLLPIISLLLAYGLNNQWWKIFLLSGFVILSLVYLFNSSFHREDWRRLAQDVVKYKKIYMIYASSDPIKYYHPDIVIQDLNQLKKADDKKIIVIPYSTEIYGIDYQKILLDKNYRLVSKKTVRLLQFEEWGYVNPGL